MAGTDDQNLATFSVNGSTSFEMKAVLPLAEKACINIKPYYMYIYQEDTVLNSMISATLLFIYEIHVYMIILTAPYPKILCPENVHPCVTQHGSRLRPRSVVCPTKWFLYPTQASSLSRRNPISVLLMSKCVRSTIALWTRHIHYLLPVPNRLARLLRCTRQSIRM